MVNFVNSSFRDPSGRVFTDGGEIFRAVFPAYQNDYDFLMSSGLYGSLSEKGCIVKHEEIPPPDKLD